MFARLAQGERLLRRLEGAAQRRRRRQSIPVECLAEVRQITVVGTAEGGPVGGGRGEDDGARIFQGVDEASRITGGDDDHPPLDARLVEDIRQVGGREVDERKPGIRHGDDRIRGTVRRNGQEQHVPVQIHAGGETLKRVVETGHAGQRRAVEMPHVVDQGKLPAAHAVAIAQHAGRQADFMREHLLLAHARKAEEKCLWGGGCVPPDMLERLVDAGRLFEQRGLSRGPRLIGRRRIPPRFAVIPRIPHIRNGVERIARPDEGRDEDRPQNGRGPLRPAGDAGQSVRQEKSQVHGHGGCGPPEPGRRQVGGGDGNEQHRQQPGRHAQDQGCAECRTRGGAPTQQAGEREYPERIPTEQRDAVDGERRLRLALPPVDGQPRREPHQPEEAGGGHGVAVRGRVEPPEAPETAQRLGPRRERRPGETPGRPAINQFACTSFLRLSRPD